jgi:hypothetical protein
MNKSEVLYIYLNMTILFLQVGSVYGTAYLTNIQSIGMTAIIIIIITIIIRDNV